MGRRLQADRPQPISGDGAWQPGLSSVTTSGVQFAEVKVDIETGIVKVIACWRSGLRPHRQPADGREPGLRRRGRIAELRAVRGSDPRSQHRSDGEPEYGVVSARRHVRHSEDRRSTDRSAGARSRSAIGEPPTVSTAAAIALAVRNAIGVTVRSLPLTPAKILQTLAQQTSLA